MGVPEGGIESSPDAAPDQPIPDLGPEPTPEAGPEPTPEAGPEPTAEPGGDRRNFLACDCQVGVGRAGSPGAAVPPGLLLVALCVSGGLRHGLRRRRRA